MNTTWLPRDAAGDPTVSEKVTQHDAETEDKRHRVGCDRRGLTTSNETDFLTEIARTGN